MILMPELSNNFLVMPVSPQDGDHEHSTAVLIFSLLAISKVFSAPFIKYSVTSFPVTFLRLLLSEQVSKTLPFLRLTGGRGVGNPPNSSGHTEMKLHSPNFLTKDETGNLRPCHLQGTPKRHELIKMVFIIYCLNSILKLIKRNLKSK